MAPAIGSEKVAEIEARLQALGVREEDLVERFVRSTGPGGQKVNKTSSAVYLKHLPTGIEVKAQSSRSQATNRVLARRRLAERLERSEAEHQAAEAARLAKIRRQKRKRSKRAKAKAVEAKRRQGDKKQLRGRVDPDRS